MACSIQRRSACPMLELPDEQLREIAYHVDFDSRYECFLLPTALCVPG